MANQEKLIVHLHWFVKTIQWFLPLTRCHFQPLVTFGHSWLEMAPRERQKPFHFLNTSVDKQILNTVPATRMAHLKLDWPALIFLYCLPYKNEELKKIVL